MFAINHASTALILKKRYQSVSIVWLLISVQLMEFVWVALNYFGVEKTTTDEVVHYVGDIHLSYMPYSHSIVTMLGVAIIAWIILAIVLKKPILGIAVAIGIASHLFLDLLTHAKDMAIAPNIDEPRFGLGLYASLPSAAFLLETFYGIFCWWIYKGEKALLAVIVIFNLANVSMFFPNVPGVEYYLANKPTLITTLILAQIVITLMLVGVYSKKKAVTA